MPHMTNLPLRLEGSFEQWWFVAPIDWAAANGHTEVVKELLRMDPSLLHNLTSKRQMRRLERLWNDQDAFSDAAIGRSKVVKDLLREFLIGQQLPNGKGDGDSCIHEPKVDDLRQLIAHGLFKSGYSVWVLYIAAAAGDEGLVNQMIATNPELIKGDGEFGLSDLLYAAARGRNIHIFQQILTLAKRVKASHIDGKSGEASPMGADDDDKNLISSNDMDFVGLSYNNRTIQSKALLAAARAGNVEMVRELLKDSSTHATALSFRDSNGTTALHAAAGRGHLEVVKLILELCPSSIHGQDGKGNTALHTAARRACLKVATELMRFDKELIYIRNKNGETPLHLGVTGSKQPLPKLILKQGGQTEVVKQIIVCNNNSVLEYVNWKTNEGDTALHLSVMSPRIDDKIVALLLQSPGIHVLETDKKGLTALDLAQACRDSFPAAEFRCNIAISLLNAAISSGSAAATATAGRLSTGQGSAAISVDLADPLMCSFSHDIAIPSDAESRSSGRRNFARRSLSADWATDFQTSIGSKGAPTTCDTNAVVRQQGEATTAPDEGTLSRNLAVLRQTSLGIFETRRGATTIGSPSPMQCFSSLQSLFLSSTFGRATLSGTTEMAPILQGKKWNKFRKCMSVQNGSPQPLRQQFSSTANVLFHPNTPMESLELRQEAAPSICVSPFASPTGSTDQSPTFSSPSYIKSWLKGAMWQAPSSSSSQRSTRQRMKKRLKQIASLTHLSLSSASETHSIHEQQVNDAYPNLRRRFLSHDGATADRLNANELGTPLIQDRLSRQSSAQSYMDCYHPCFCLDNWCQDGQHSTKLQTREGQTHARTVAAQNAHLSEVASSTAANVVSNGLISRSQSSRSYKPKESPSASDHTSTPANRGHLQCPNASPRRSGGSSPTISARPSASLSLSPWLSPSLRAARKQKVVVPETTAKDGNCDEAEVSASLIGSKNARMAGREPPAEGSQEDPSVCDLSAGAALQQSKQPARQDSFRFCACGPCFQEDDIDHGSGETPPHTKARGRQRVYHT